MFAKELSCKIFSPPRHQGTFFFIRFFLCVFVSLWLFPVYPGWVYRN
ncbi:hypothetical protein D1AOALGA4SA_817 [Olavius algarvensis Delta 1 endosymbiont]|nr:hypothetical protein D1AOALGA4SA_817 [Olavius algarvensis Delta 1 endosymbiont]